MLQYVAMSKGHLEVFEWARSNWCPYDYAVFVDEEEEVDDDDDEDQDDADEDDFYHREQDAVRYEVYFIL